MPRLNEIVSESPLEAVKDSPHLGMLGYKTHSICRSVRFWILFSISFLNFV